MPFDQEGYCRTVLAPGLARNVLPQDLRTRYAIRDGDLTGPAAFYARIDEVVRCWKGLQAGAVYGRTASRLLAAHTALHRENHLTPAFFRDCRERRVREAAARLDAVMRENTAGCISPGQLARLFGLIDPDQVLDRTARQLALKRHRVRLIERPWRLPEGSPPPGAAALREHLSDLDLLLSVDLLFGAEAVRAGFRLDGGFRLSADGRRVTARVVEERGEKGRGAARDLRKTATDTVLTVVRTALTDGFDALILWEVCEALRVDLDERMPPRVSIAKATALGLDRSEAEEIVQLLTERAGRPVTTGPRHVLELLDSGRLRAARAQAAALSNAQRAEVEPRLAAAERAVADLTERAEQARLGRDPEECAAILADASRLATDDEDLHRRLRAIAPPPPSEVRADVVEGRVTVRWRSGAFRTGDVRHRITRLVGSDSTTAASAFVIADSTGNTVVDDTPPRGEWLTYTVAATRAAEVWSAPATSNEVVVTPEVADLRVSVYAAEVTGFWRPPPGVHDLVVIRTTPAGDAIRLGAVTPTGFLDRDVVTGKDYDYTVRARYVGRDGTRHVSAGRTIPARPRPVPVPVTDLIFLPPSDGAPDQAAALCPACVSRESPAVTPPDAAQVIWTSPPAGLVEIILTENAPAWVEGETVPASEVTGHGKVLTGVPEPRRDGRVALDLGRGRGMTRCYLTAVTFVPGNAFAGIGRTVRVSLLDPVTDLRAQRRPNLPRPGGAPRRNAGRSRYTTRLHWSWPDGATSALVRWRPATVDTGGGTGIGIGIGAGAADRDPTGAEPWRGGWEISRSRYREHGMTVEVGAGPVIIEVRAQVNADVRARSAPARVHLPAEPVRVAYTLRMSSPAPWRHTATVELVAERSTRLPPLVVVAHPDGTPPLGPDDGRAVATLVGGRATAGEPVVTTFEAPSRRLDGLACFVDPSTSGPDEAAAVRLERRDDRTR